MRAAHRRHGCVDMPAPGGASKLNERAAQVDSIYTIFEGTSEIQRLVIARAISGIHIQ